MCLLDGLRGLQSPCHGLGVSGCMSVDWHGQVCNIMYVPLSKYVLATVGASKIIDIVVPYSEFDAIVSKTVP